MLIMEKGGLITGGRGERRLVEMDTRHGQRQRQRQILLSHLGFLVWSIGQVLECDDRYLCAYLVSSSEVPGHLSSREGDTVKGSGPFAALPSSSTASEVGDPKEPLLRMQYRC
jgi:hypothetical protein